MKVKSLKPLGLFVSVSLMSGLVASAGAAESSRARDKNPAGLVAAADQQSSQSAQKLIGQDVKNTTGEGLGQVKDLIIDARAGKIIYAIVGSGGLLGVGEKIRAVPFAALKNADRAENDPVLDIERRAWDGVPAIRENEIDTLLTEARGRTVFEQFGLDWSDEMKRERREARAAGGAREDTPKLMRVSRLNGKDVVNAGQQIGKIEDVVLNLESRRASVLLDPNDDYTGTDQKFIIDFNQLSPSLDEPEKLTTVLTRAEFARATPMERDWWQTAVGYPYIWTGYGAAGGPTYSTAVADMADPMRTAADRRDREAKRPAIAVVRNAVRDDETLGDAADNLSLEERGNTIVVEGTVRTKEMKRKIDERLAQVAPGWEIDNQVKVESVGE